MILSCCVIFLAVAIVQIKTKRFNTKSFLLSFVCAAIFIFLNNVIYAYDTYVGQEVRKSGYYVGYERIKIKQKFLSSAQHHKNEAYRIAKKLEKELVYLPDLGEQKHLKTLIYGSIGSVITADIRQKILSVGLSLIASIADSAYDKYVEMRSLSFELVYHIELDIFYSELSLHCDDDIEVDEGCNKFFQAINFLTMADLCAYGIQNHEIRQVVSSILCSQRDFIFSCFNGERLTCKVSGECELFYENLGEVLSEVSDKWITSEIDTAVELAIWYLKKAELFWSIK